jgi:hypothetical protein
MSNDLSSLENDLRKLRAAALDDAMMERLEECAADTWDTLRPLELEMEHRLRAHEPAPLEDAMLERMLAHVDGLSFPKSQPKILPFPATVAAEPRTASRGGRWLAAAAAVAMMGALAGWFVPHGSNTEKPLAASSGQRENASSRPHLTAPSGLVPAGINRGLSEASDEGVVLNQNSQPHRVLKFVYNERVTLKDANGRTYHVDRPRVEYLIVPAKTD